LSHPVVFYPAQSLTTPHPRTSFFPEPVDPGLLQMVDQEARSHDGDSHSSGGDSLQEVLFKQPAVKPPAVAVNMCVTHDLMPPNVLPLTHAPSQEVGWSLRSCRARVFESPPKAEVFV
jgi:hypothetical protein